MSERVELPTIGMILLCYAVWTAAIFWLSTFAIGWAVFGAAIAIALHASLQHEVIHGHPTPKQWVNEAMVLPALTLLIPFYRFRDTHIAHHMDAELTDPYDDPETNFLDEGDWESLSTVCRMILLFNNTLAGRLLIGVIVAQIWFMASDWRAIRRGDPHVLRGWMLHLPATAAVLLVVQLSPMAIWQYLIAAYVGNAIIKIRTFAEHQAEKDVDARTVIIEDKGPLSFLFLNNNLHAVHHAKPGIAWYDLPKVFRADREQWLDHNNGYRFSCYASLFQRYFLTRKDPVSHPLWRQVWKV